MSQRKKHRNKPRNRTVRTQTVKNRPPWLALIVFGLMLIGGVFLLVQASRSGEANSTTSSADDGSGTVTQVVGAPRVAVAQSTIDHGDVKLNNFVNSSFVVRNVGDQDLVILGEPRVELVEGC